MQGEFKLPTEFLIWWLVQTPKRIFVTGKRFMILVNNALSFTLNIRLIFTPLFKDYTLIGRFIGFCIRIIQIIFGLLFIGVLTTIWVLLPLFWLLLPIILFEYIKLWVILVYALVYVFWVASERNTPKKRAANILDSEYLGSFRPKTKAILNKIHTNFSEGIKLLTQLPEITLILKKAELDSKQFAEKINSTPKFETQELGKRSFEYAKKEGSRYVEPEQLFLAVVGSISKIDNLLATFGLGLEDLEKAIEWVVTQKEYKSKIYIWQDDCAMLFVGGVGKGMTGRVTPLLDSVSEDYTRQVQKGRIGKIVDRENEIKKVAELLTGSRENILIIGNPGSGKTSIVRGMAYKIIEGTEYKGLKNRRLVSLDIGDLISDTKSPGEVASKLTKVLKELQGSGDVILFIDEIHNLVAGTGDKSAETSTIYSILEPSLVSDKIQFIGATSIPNYRKYIEPNGAFARLFNIIEINEASKTDTIDILKASAEKYERKNHVLVTYLALKKAVDLSEKLIHERVLPDKALDILNRVVSRVTNSTRCVNSQEISKEISEMTHIPVENITQDEASKLLGIEETMKKMVIGQDEAIKQIGSALKRARIGIRNEDKPIASFLFVGTTGVGKTQTAKALAKSYFGNPKTMIRIDMSEYQQLDSLNRLIGNPDGSSKGILTEAVRTKPFSLVLLDEIEKAHPNILLLFLQVLDEGRLTDSSGTVVSFTNSIVISTSNVGTRSIQKVFQQGGNFEEMSSSALKDVREIFAPEFLNRFTGIIVFNPLSVADVRKICDLLLSDVRNIAEEKGIKLTFKQEMIDELIKRGYSPEWGARPLARVIEDTVESYIATKMLRNEIQKGDEVSLGMEVFAQTAA